MSLSIARVSSIGIALSVVAACATSETDPTGVDPAPAAGTSPTTPTADGFGQNDAGEDDSPIFLDRDPETCAEAKKGRSYIGCDYWPTVTANFVPSVFDYAVVVANTGKNPADVKVTGPNNVSKTVTVEPGALEKIYLPWVAILKGDDIPKFGSIPALTESVLAKGGAYHLVSSVPVIVYQFNALEYKGGTGGPPGKDWGDCTSTDCFSYTNDASLLLPSTAWTTSYRITGVPGFTRFGYAPIQGSYIVVTAAQDGTTVSLALGSKGTVVAGPGISNGNGPGTTASVTLNAGDAVELVTPKGVENDLSGSLLTSSKPVQVITGISCVNVPADSPACDHLEESVLPAEALGKRYVITTPTRPAGGGGLHVVRFYGNRDGTTLTYSPAKPKDCPDTLAAGQVAECGPLGEDFVVESSQEFGVSGIQVSASVYSDGKLEDKTPGDPSQTSFAAIEQFRDKYIFLSPDDYDVSYAVVVGPEDAKPIIDGVELTGYTAIAGGQGVWRATLGAGTAGAHTLTSTKKVGLQVIGYGAYTSYQYPGGLNVQLIAPPPPPPTPN